MADIYQQIWNADQDHNGLPAFFSNQQADPTDGYVLVNSEIEDNLSPDLRVLTEAVIPTRKQTTYELCKRLFNNYALPEGDIERDTEEERAERHAFIEAIKDTPPMERARDYIASRVGEVMTAERWHTTLMDHWFREFSQGGDPALTGFEHVIVGEQEGGKVQGYHFWYKYFLDDGFARQVDDGASVVPGLGDDRIIYQGPKTSDGQMSFPETVTISFRWDAPDYDRLAVRPLYKRIGGFFVGCSVEGLMALGTVRAHMGAQAPKTAVIEGARYDMKLFRSSNNMHIRTFYPVFKGAADPVSGDDDVPVSPSQPVPAHSVGEVRLLAARVNPEGHDPGNESIIMINAGPTAAEVNGWRVVDKNGRSTALGVASLPPGEPYVLRLDAQGAQLSNKGGTILLQRPDGTVVHRVSYSKAQARRQNATLIFS